MAGAGVKDKFEVKEDSEKVDIGEFGDKISEGWIDISVSNNDDINTGDYIITTSSYDTNTGATYHYTSS
jgi:hypothetical protein